MLHLMNNMSAANTKVDVLVKMEPLADGSLVHHLKTTLTLPARASRQFAYIHLDRLNGVPRVVANLSQTPVSSVSRIISAWGTEPDNSQNIRQIQTDRIVRFRGSYTFHSDLGEPNGFTHNFWWKRGSEGAWPSSLCAALRFRGESYYIGPDNNPNNPLKHSQANFAGVDVVDGDTGLPTMGFVTQVKGPGGYASDDNMRVMIAPGANWVGVMAGQDSRGFFLITGYELLPT